MNPLRAASPIQMRILFFDTETNGLPKFRTAVLASDWPAIVQVAWQVWDVPVGKEPALHSAASYLVKPPPSLAWDLGSQAIHLITKEKALAEGTDPAEVWDAFAATLADCVFVVAHNLAFDKAVMDADAVRRGAAPYGWPSLRVPPGIECCTMQSTKAFCRLPTLYPRAEDPYKYPKLSELHSLLFGNKTLLHFHNATVDVDCTVQCFLRLVELKVLPLDDWRFAVRLPLRGGDP